MTNTYKFSDDGKTCTIFFKDGQGFLIDATDFPKVSQKSWQYGKRGYPTSHTSRSCGHGFKTVTLHKFLLNPEPGYDIDHISRDKLDNRRCNLRICTHQENMFNQKKRSTNSTGYMGVSFLKCAGKYEAYVHRGGHKNHLGLFDSPVEAALARDRAVRILFGEYANLNFGGGSIEDTEAGEKVHAALIAV